MNSLRIYTYAGCDTCSKALKFLKAEGLKPEVIPIRERPPARPELKAMLARYGGELRKLFNTSGQDYRSLGLKDRLPTLTESEALSLLSKNGNLVKRPFLILGEDGCVGFSEADWKRRLSGRSR